MALTDIAHALRTLKTQLLREATLYPASADRLNYALAHLNDVLLIVDNEAAKVEPEMHSASPEARAAIAEAEDLRRQLAEARGEEYSPAPRPAPPEPAAPVAPEDRTSADFGSAGGDLIPGPNVELPLPDPETLAAEQARMIGHVKRAGDPAEPGWG